MERETELRLVARLKQGDATAFDLVYEAFRPRLYAFLVRLSRRRDVAEDLLEETWLRLVSRATDLADDTRFGPWLFTVARNLYVSWRRSRALDTERVGELTPSWPGTERGESPFEAAARAELEGQIEAALAGLSLRDREALLLVAVEELTPSEAAAVCRQTPEAFRKRLQRARERLGDALRAAGVQLQGSKETRG